MLSALGHASRLINWLTGGEYGESLCARIAVAHGDRCAFCAVIGAILRDEHHCRDERRYWAVQKRR